MKVKISTIFLGIVIINLMFFNMNQVNAVDSALAGASDFITSGQGTNRTLVEVDESQLAKASSWIYNILFLIATGIAVVMSGILGIKFMIGSAEEKAEIKDSLIPFIVGCIVVFGSLGIWKIFMTFGNLL